MSATSSSTPNMGPTVVPPTADDNLKELSSSGGEAAISATPSRPSASGTSKSEHTTPSSFDGRDIELAQSLAVKSLLSFSEYNTELPRDSLFMKWAEEISKIKPKLLNVEGKATTETLIPLLDDTRGPLDLLGRLNFLKNFVYQTLGIRARLYEGSHLIAGMCIWFIYLLWAKPPISNLVSVIFSPAYAQTDGLPLSLTGLKQRFGENRVDLIAYGRTRWS